MYKLIVAASAGLAGAVIALAAADVAAAPADSDSDSDSDTVSFVAPCLEVADVNGDAVRRPDGTAVRIQRQAPLDVPVDEPDVFPASADELPFLEEPVAPVAPGTVELAPVEAPPPPGFNFC